MSASKAARRRTEWAVSAAAVLTGLAAVSIPFVAVSGPLGLRVGVVGALAAVGSGWSRARWLAGPTCVAAVLLVLLSAVFEPMSVPAAALTGLLLLGYVVLVDLAGQLDRASLAAPGIAGWGRDQAPALVAAISSVLVLVAVLGLPWRPGALLVAVAPALLVVGAFVALTGVGASRRVRRSGR